MVIENVEIYISRPEESGAAELGHVASSKKLKLDFDDSDDDEPAATPQLSDRYLIEDEIRLYKGFPVPDEDTDPLSWWNERVPTLPIMYKVATKCLLIPATSVPCERLFSIAGHICNKKRSALSPDNLERLVLLNQWAD